MLSFLLADLWRQPQIRLGFRRVLVLGPSRGGSVSLRVLVSRCVGWGRGAAERRMNRSPVAGTRVHIMQLDPARPMCAKSNLIEGRMNYIRTASLLIFHNYIFQAKSNTIFVSTIIFNINFCMRQEIVIICSLYCVPLCCKTLISRWISYSTFIQH